MNPIVRVAGILAALLVCAGSGATRAQETGRVVTARAGILVDGETGHVLWQRQADLPLPPASTTKVLTALMAIESGRLDDPFWVSQTAALTPPSKIGLRAGWRVRLHDLVYAVLLNSANDASVVIAEGLAGSVEEFARRMNRYARHAGAWNSHFVNPHGLPADGHYSTARDLALLFARALGNPDFARIAGTRTTAIVPAAGSTRVIALRNHNRLLHDYHIHVIGKTGWTRAARKCFVGAGSLGGRQVIVAVLGSTDLWGDLKALLGYAFGEETGPILEPPAVRVAARTRDPLAAADAWEAAAERARLSPAFSAPGRPARILTNRDLEAARGRALPARPPARTAAARPATAQPPAARRAGKDAPGPAYFVKLGTFDSRAQAERIRAAMTRQGYRATVVRIRQRPGDAWRISVGAYRDRTEARQAARRLARAYPQYRSAIIGG